MRTRVTATDVTPFCSAALPTVTAEERGEPLSRRYTSVVEDGCDLRIAYVRLVIVEEAGVDDLLELLALESLHGSLDCLVANVDRVLGDSARHETLLNRLLLLLAGIVADDDDFPVHLPGSVDHADRRTFVGAEDALELRIGLENRLRDLRRLQVIAGAVLDAHDIDLRVLLLDAVHEAVPPVDARAAGLVVHHESDVAFATDQFGHL